MCSPVISGVERVQRAPQRANQWTDYLSDQPYKPDKTSNNQGAGIMHT